MQFGSTPEEARFRQEVRAWLAANAPTTRRPDDGPAMRDFDLAWQRRKFEAGWAGIAWPRDHGGRGLSLADVVVEHYAEGGITRFTALYQANAPDKVGSVRSCRLIDLELPQIFDAGLVCSGTSPGVKQLMRQSPAFLDERTMIADLGQFSGCKGCPMYRTRDAGVPHNLFASAVNAWAVLDQRGKNQPSAFRAWPFDAAPPSSGWQVTSLNIPYTSVAARWPLSSRRGSEVRNRGPRSGLSSTRPWEPRTRLAFSGMTSIR